MEKSTQKFFSTKNIVYFAVLTALVIVLQLWGSAIQIAGVSLNLSLIPIVLGALILGIGGGALLGFISGLIVFLSGVIGVEPFTNYLFINHPVYTAFICLAKTTVAGAVSGLVYKFFREKRKYLGTYLSSALVPIVNTTLFVVLTLFISGTLKSGGYVKDGDTVIYTLIFVFAGVNFLIELAINILVAPALFRVVDVLEKQVFNR